MQRPQSFRGQSGQLYRFRQVAMGEAWRGRPGVALLAAPDFYGWRIIRIVEITGRRDDFEPLHALADARAYGGDTVLVMDEPTPAARLAMIADLDAGLNPVWRWQGQPRAAMALAA